TALEAVKVALEADHQFNHPGNSKYTAGQTLPFYRLKEGIERFFITDINNPAGSAKAQSVIPAMWDTILTTAGGRINPTSFNHVPGGVNVLFMDGHVEFGKFPQETGSKFFMLTTEVQSGVHTNPFP
ncbi:MAG: hypothetical protein IT364_09345, partial [Candidatus Hydrogenedentes bacterium]|nr:hypothetical protein [Candidatus Hydrogenedentota bacterium]